jgi:hypothetical protein
MSPSNDEPKGVTFSIPKFDWQNILAGLEARGQIEVVK